MKTRETFPGKTYSVHTANGCTVSDDSGWSKEIEAPDGYFTAHGSTVYLSDDEATMREVFKLAPVASSSGGGGLPKTDYLIYNSDYTEVSGNLDNLKNGDGKFKSLKLKSWDIDLPSLITGKQMFQAAFWGYSPLWKTSLPSLTHGNEMFAQSHIAAFEAELPSLTDATKMFQQANGLKHFKGNMPLLKTATYMFFVAKCTTFEGDMPSVTNVNFMFQQSNCEHFKGNMPALTSSVYMFSTAKNLTSFSGDLSALTNGGAMFSGCENFSIFDSVTPLLVKGVSMFNKCILNKESTLRFLNSIPSWSDGAEHKITIGIHIDHQTDEEVLAAIANAESKGWALTVEWNGTATAAASVMRFGQLIYAKVGEIEMPDGTTERVLDWGHYVTDETGYETFRSLESAYEYFGLPMPEQNEESQPTE